MRLVLVFTLNIIYLNGIAQINHIDIFGHRGFRGKYPENSLIGFQKALELKITGIELDVVVNKDKQLVISHEPFFKREFCLDSSGNNILRGNDYNIYELTQNEISKFDCGSKFYSKFPQQQKINTCKPLFQDIIKQIDFNDVILLIEIKSNPKEYGISQPEPKEYCQLIIHELKNCPNKSNIRIMSFDSQILEELHRTSTEFPLVYLTFLPKSANYFLKKLTFTPYALGMFYPTINKRKTNLLHKLNIKLFAWTVNSTSKKERLIKYKIDGIITDFPDVLKNN